MPNLSPAIYAPEEEYIPWPTLRRFHASSAFFRGVMGPYGSGKSSACVQELTSRAEEQQPSRKDGVRRTRFAVVRSTYPELTDTTIKTWMRWFPAPQWGIYRQSPHPDYLMRWRLEDDGSLVESEINFRALDQPKHVRMLKSWEITGYWMNEASEIPRAVKDALDARVGRYPDPRDVAATWRGGIGDTNPPDTDHWWHTLAEEDRPDNHEFFSQPSGLSDEAENVEYLPGECDIHRKARERAELRGQGNEYVKPPCRACGRLYYVEFGKGKAQEWIDVFVHGKYGFVFDGKAVYKDCYFPALHDSPVPLEAVKGVEILQSTDWGLTPATIWLQLLPGARVRCLRELCSDSMGAERHAEEVLAFRRTAFPHHTASQYRGFADPAGWAQSQTDEKTCADIFAAKGMFLQPGAVDFAARFEAMKHIFGLIYDGRGAVQIDPRCTVFKKAMLGGYHFRRVQVPGKERFMDKPEKNHPYSDIANAAEYAVSRLFNVATVTRMETAKKEESVRSRWREKHGITDEPSRGKRSWATR